MVKRETKTVSFTPEQAEFVAACVSTGRYQSVSEVVQEALRLLEDHEAHRQSRRARARSLVQEGVDQLDRGEVIDDAAFFQEWDEELRRLERELPE